MVVAFSRPSARGVAVRGLDEKMSFLGTNLGIFMPSKRVVLAKRRTEHSQEFGTGKGW